MKKGLKGLESRNCCSEMDNAFSEDVSVSCTVSSMVDGGDWILGHPVYIAKLGLACVLCCSLFADIQTLLERQLNRA